MKRSRLREIISEVISEELNNWNGRVVPLHTIIPNPFLRAFSPQIDEASDAAKQAKSMGLEYLGFGRYGKDGKTTHTVDNGQLVKVKTADDFAADPEGNLKKFAQKYAAPKGAPNQMDSGVAKARMALSKLQLQAQQDMHDPENTEAGKELYFIGIRDSIDAFDKGGEAALAKLLKKAASKGEDSDEDRMYLTGVKHAAQSVSNSKKPPIDPNDDEAWMDDPNAATEFDMGYFDDSDESEQKHPDGSVVTVPNKGKMVKGKVVRYDKGSLPGESPFYVVDVGEYESIKVPAHDIDTQSDSPIQHISLTQQDRGVTSKQAALVDKIGEKLMDIDLSDHYNTEMTVDEFSKLTGLSPQAINAYNKYADDYERDFSVEGDKVWIHDPADI